MNVIAKMNLNNAVERVLHVPGNYTGGILEMTFVVDCGLPAEYVKKTSAEIAATLRAHSEVFRNVRLNLLYYKSEEELENRVVPISFLQMGRCFDGYERREEDKSLDCLAGKLKLFHARSKLILVLAGEELKIRDKEVLQQNFQPFLGKKSLFLKVRYQRKDGQEGDGQESSSPEGRQQEDNCRGEDFGETQIRCLEDGQMKWVRGAELGREWEK